MKNICFLVGNLNNSGGTERVTTIIANELVNKGFSVSILNLEDGSNPFFKLDNRISVIGIYSSKVSYKLYYLPTIYKIRNYVVENKINTLIVVDSISCVLSVPALFGLKVNHICWEHFNFNVNLGLKVRDFGRKWAAKYCNHVVTLTQRDKELWEENLDKIKAKIKAIPNPTPYIKIEHIPRKDYKTVLAVGRLTSQKGFDLLIEAWSEVCKVNQDWILRIVGNGEDEEILKKQAHNLNILDRIDFVPATKNIEYYYRASSFYCMSSRFEGLPMVLLEAQSYGLPIVSFDCNTGPAEIINDGFNGFLVKNDEILDLADNILKIINIDDIGYRNMCLFSMENIKKFSSQNILNKWIEILGT